MYKTWVKTFFTVFITGITIVITVNIIADPMMVLPFVHKLNNRSRDYNVRHQKTNLLYFSNYYGVKDYDGIILGSSRSVCLDQNLFSPKYTVFNYAAAASRPQEAISYLSFAQELHGKPLQLIVMGLDFFASNGKRSKSRVKGIPVVYTQEVKKPFYTIAHLLNLKAFHLSTRIIRANLHGTKPYYWERKYNSTIEYFRPTPQTQEESFNKTIADYKGMYSSFTYNPDYKQVLQEIKNTFPKAEFMVFTTPVSKPHLDMLFEYGLKESYKQWLKDIVDVFGNVTHFMDENEVTENYKEYFSDSHHLYPKSTDLIIKRLLNEKDETLPKDFGKMLTKENLQTYLDQI